MIYPENAASPPSIHTTLVFKPSGLLDPLELVEALRMLGVPETPLVTAPDNPQDTMPGITTGPELGHWLACGLDSDGKIRLWPSVSLP